MPFVLTKNLSISRWFRNTHNEICKSSQQKMIDGNPPNEIDNPFRCMLFFCFRAKRDYISIAALIFTYETIFLIYFSLFPCLTLPSHFFCNLFLLSPPPLLLTISLFTSSLCLSFHPSFPSSFFFFLQELPFL